MLPTQIWIFIALNRGQFSIVPTVRKFHNFYVTQILSVINFGEIWSSENAVFAIKGALNFVKLENISLQQKQKFTKKQNSEPLNLLKWQIFLNKSHRKFRYDKFKFICETLDPPTLVSRKIWIWHSWQHWILCISMPCHFFTIFCGVMFGKRKEMNYSLFKSIWGWKVGGNLVMFYISSP